MCDTPNARITGLVSSLWVWVGDSPCNYSVAIRVNKVMLVSLCAETIKPDSERDKNKQEGWNAGRTGQGGSNSSLCALKLYILSEDKCDGFGKF